MAQAAQVSFTYSDSGKNAQNTPDYSQTSPRRQFRSEVSHGVHEPERVCFRYASVLAVDVAAFGNVETEVATSSYWIEFDVTTDSPSQPWRVKLASHRRGDCNIRNDGGAYATSQIAGPMSATYTLTPPGGTPQALTELQFGPVSASNEGNSGNHAHTDIEQEGVAYIDGVGTRRVRVSFHWWSSVVSHGGIAGGDEAAVRLGLPTTGLNRITAGDYPGTPARSQSNDGHFICATFCALPSTSISANSTSVCAGSSVTLTAIGGYGSAAEWFEDCCCGTVVPGAGRSITVNPTETTTYFMRWKGGSACQSSNCDPNPELIGCGDSPCSPGITIQVTPPPSPPSAVYAASSTICAGSTTVLTSTGGSGQVQRWYAGGCGGSPLPFTGSTISVSPTVTTTYFTRFESSPCTPSSCRWVTVQVIQPALAPTSITASSAAVCLGTPVTLTANGGSGDTLQWFEGACGSTVIGTGPSITVTPVTGTTYYARWTRTGCDPSPCVSTTITMLSLPSPPTAITVSQNPTCEGGAVTLTVVGGNGDFVRWFSGGCTGASLGIGTSLIVHPSATTTYYARWETTGCGVSDCWSTVVAVNETPTPPASALATDICQGESTYLTVLGGSGQVLKWREGSPSAPPFYVGAPVPVEVAPSSTTTYFASFGAQGCPDSSSVSVTVQVFTAPPNDDCPDAIELAVGISPASIITGFTNRCATTDGPAHPACAYDGDPEINQDVWYRYQAPVEGRLRLSTCYPAVTSFDTRLAVYEGAGCPVDDARLLTCVDDSGPGCSPGSTVNLRVEAGMEYWIRVGGRGDASGTGQLLAQLTPAPACPPPGTSMTQTYSLCGVATGVSWMWKIQPVGGGFTALQGTAAAVPAGGSAFQLSSSFASSINSAVGLLPGGCAGSLSASALLIGLTDCGGAPSGSAGPAGLSLSCTVPVELFVSDPDGVWCLIDSDPSTPICQFNPVAEQVPLPGNDCNQNGVDDLIDIYLGTSLDLDGDLIPDECALRAGTAYCFGDGAGVGCPCGNDAPLGFRGGCLNSLGTGGRLAAFGKASLGEDTLVLEAEGMPNSTALYFQGTSQIAAPFGDGLRCAGGSVLRLGTRTNVGNASQFPASGGPAISVKGQVTTPGQTRTYQVWYRDTAAFCEDAPFNLTNGVAIVWAP